MLETTPATTAPCMLKGSSVYTTKTMNRKKGTWGQGSARLRHRPRCPCPRTQPQTELTWGPLQSLVFWRWPQNPES